MGCWSHLRRHQEPNQVPRAREGVRSRKRGLDLLHLYLEPLAQDFQVSMISQMQRALKHKDGKDAL